jgi:hypothetical protein
MDTEYLEQEIKEILSIEKDLFKNELIPFKEFQTEKIGFGPWIKTGTIMMLLRLKSLRNKIKSEKDPIKKMDLLGLQNLYLGSLITVSISFDTKNKTILQRGKSIMK